MVDRQRNGRLLRWLLFMCGIAAAAILVFVVARPALDTPRPIATAPRGSQQEAALLELRGDGDAVTDRFEVRANWEIRWDPPNAAPLMVELFNGEGESRGIVVEDDAGTGGSVFVSESGTFYLLVTTDGLWRLTVHGESP